MLLSGRRVMSKMPLAARRIQEFDTEEKRLLNETRIRNIEGGLSRLLSTNSRNSISFLSFLLIKTFM